MIVTCKREVPFRWIGFAILPWAAFTFNSAVISVVFLFSLKKFIENPAGLTFILSLPGFTSIILQPAVSFISDRIWTRFGRRKPFILTAIGGNTVGLFLMPLMPNFWCLLGLFLVYNALADLNSPMEPFKQEIIPPQERGRATGAMSWCSNLGTLLFYFVALGRFDDVRYFAGFPLHGETAIYWSGGLLFIVIFLLVALGIKEVDQKSPLRGQKLSLQNFVGGLLDRELWPVYMLVVGASCLNFYSGLGALSNLLYTDQWGYTKQEMGVNVAIGGVINLVAIGFLTIFADRFNRMRAYQILICCSLFAQVSYYCYVNFVLPDKHPSLIEIVVFGEMISILGILTGLIYVPLVYDYVRRNKMGTFNAGAQMVAKLTTLITLNGVGLFVWGYAELYQPPAGEMTRIVLRGDQNSQSDVLAALRAATWTYPGNGAAAPSSSISARAWQSNGTVSRTGRCWEVRLRDNDSQKLAAEEDSLNAEASPLLANEKMDRDQAAIFRHEGQVKAAEASEAKAGKMDTRIAKINARISTLGIQLTDRSNKFHQQVVLALGPRIITEGEQIMAANINQAVVLELGTTHRADPRLVNKMVDEFWRERPDAIDLRPLKRDQGFGLAISARVPPAADEDAFERELQAEIQRIAAKTDPGLLPPGAMPLGASLQPALTLDLMVIEDPVENYVSPINRVVNLIAGLFGHRPDPGHALASIARNLRVPAETNHVRVSPGPRPKTLSVTVLFPDTAPSAPSITDPIGQRLQVLLGAKAEGNILAQSRALYDRIEKAAATQRITVARPVLTSGYAPMRYDYMSGYLWMFFMGSIGIAVTIAFGRLEARGGIHKRGVEEAAES
jgi:Na+/melibiose symporter-like transporter